MNYNEIKKRSYDIPCFRISLFLTYMFSFPGIIICICTIISNPSSFFKESHFCVILIVIILLLCLNLSVWFFTSKIIIFNKDYVIIKNSNYYWYNLEFVYYYDKFDILTFRNNTLCISYFDYKSNSYKETYIKCKDSDYNYIMSVRN